MLVGPDRAAYALSYVFFVNGLWADWKIFYNRHEGGGRDEYFICLYGKYVSQPYGGSGVEA
ncbi:hypothetical protein KH172YL63_40720 [Bacillus sp. KH172YL63]|nr:hypothetical protein KH172YL63_40720 [Bacillus sp. KH172YL63]